MHLPYRPANQPKQRCNKLNAHLKDAAIDHYYNMLSIVEDKKNIKELHETMLFTSNGIIHLFNFHIGQYILIRDTIKKWCKSKIIRIDKNNNSIYIKYDGWTEKWNEWIDINDVDRYKTI